MVVLASSGAGASTATAPASATSPAPALDLEIQYTSKILTPEGVTRESRYQETMLRRPGHVWSARVLPPTGETHNAHASSQKVTLKSEKHAEFNHVVLPRHVALENGKLQLSYIDTKARQVVSIPAPEYDNVNFDGSWDNAYYLLDPKWLQTLPVTQRPSPVAGAVWHEREKNGVFERVLWDRQKQIPLMVETGNLGATFYHRMEVKVQSSLKSSLPWMGLQKYGQKEYSDYLD